MEQFILDIKWDRLSPDDPVMPPLIGPFPEREEAEEWAHLNIPNGTWEVRPLARPYMDPPTFIRIAEWPVPRL